MDTDLDRSRLNTANRFGQLSKNMFFARHVPQPKYLKFITGTAGVRVCHVRDNIPHWPVHPSEKIRLTKRRERVLPPIRGWNTCGPIVADVETWRHELTRIAEMVGLVTAEELEEIERKKQAVSSPFKRTPSQSANGEYSERTGRWNETPKTLSRSRSFHGRTPLSAILPTHLFCVDEQERETWILQVLCQILKTEDINEVRSWLVSSNSNEKEAVRQLIATAIRGLEESGRIRPTAYFDNNVKSIQANMDTLDSLMSNKFANVSLNDSLSTVSKDRTRSSSRPRTSSQIQSTADIQNKLTEIIPTNLESINEENNLKAVVPRSTKVDDKHDIQILTLNDDGNNPNVQSMNADQDEVPF